MAQTKHTGMKRTMREDHTMQVGKVPKKGKEGKPKVY